MSDKDAISKDPLSKQGDSSQMARRSKQDATAEEKRILSHILTLYQDARDHERHRLIGSDDQPHQTRAEQTNDASNVAQPTLGALLGMSDDQALSLIHDEVAKSIQELAPIHIKRTLRRALRVNQKQPANQLDNQDDDQQPKGP